MVRVRAVGPDELAHLRELRLRSLAESPSAFGSNFAEEKARPLSDWKRWVVGARTFVAEDGAEWCGVVRVAPDEQRRSVSHVLSMWVDPARRGSGIGLLLINAVVDYARSEGVSVLKLGVVEGNEIALRLYRSAGFVPTGEEEPLRSDPAKSVALLTLDFTELD